jgi:hypothetical protein
MVEDDSCYRGSGGHVGGGATTFHFFIFKILPTKFLKGFVNFKTPNSMDTCTG